MKRRLLLLLVLCALCAALPVSAELVEPIYPTGGSADPVYPTGGESELVEPIYPSGGGSADPVYPVGGDSELVEPVVPSGESSGGSADPYSGFGGWTDPSGGSGGSGSWTNPFGGSSGWTDPFGGSGGSGSWTNPFGGWTDPFGGSGGSGSWTNPFDSGSELVEPGSSSDGMVEFLTPAPGGGSGSGLVEFLTPAPGGGSGLVEFLTPPPAGSTQAVRFTGTITAGGVNVRSGPGLGYASYTQAYKGQVIHVTSSARDAGGTLWYYGSLTNVSGWVMARYVQSGGGSTPYTPGGSAPFTRGYVRLNGTNVRSGPGMGYASLFQVGQGTAVQVLSTAYDSAGTLWYRVSVSGSTGYIRADLVSSSGGGGFVPGPSGETPVSFTGYVTSGTANVRSSPSSSASVITVLVRGQSVPVVASVYAGGSYWYKVAYLPMRYGYVSAGLISSGGYVPTAAPTAAPYWPTPVSFYGYTNTHAVNVRNSPNGGKIDQLAKGTSVYVSSSAWAGGVQWYFASYSGGSGYIRADLISRGSSPHITPRPTWHEIPTSYSGMTIKDKCNIRVGPGYEWDAVDQINYGERVTASGLCYDGSGNTWYHITYLSGRSGYILTDLVGAYDADAIRRHRAAAVTAPPAPPQEYVVYVTVTPTPAPYSPYTYSFVNTAQPTAAPTAFPASASAPVEALDFTGFTASSAQTLPVYSAPSADAWISDNGTASITTSGNIWVGGYEGQWLLVLYQNSQKQTRVGYVNGFSLQGTLPEAGALVFSYTPAVLSSQAVLTDDPLGKTSSILSLNAGSQVTFLSKCYLGSLWAYVETAIGGRPVRGFIPLSSLDAVK